MNRSILLARLRSRKIPFSKSIGSGNYNAPCAKFHSSSSSSNSSRQSSSNAFWVGAAATCIFFQAYDNHHHHHHHYTMAEGRRDNSNENEDDEDDDGTPWYQRYPSLNLNRMRTPTFFQKSSDDDETDTKGEPLDNKTLFYGQCLQRQLWQPPVPYPAWDFNWDGKMLDDFSTMDVLLTAEGLQQSHKTGTTRHILLVRHGQYEEGDFDDRKRYLTPLGRRQAQLTGKRLAALVQAIGEDKINAIYTSDMLRAKQTAWIMAKSLPDSIPIRTPDPDLNEALPAQIVPPRPDLRDIAEEVDENRERMDRVFRRYFHRADPPPELKKALQQQHQPQQEPQEVNITTSGTIQLATNNDNTKTATTPIKLPPPKHEFDIIVCHGNLIRFFACKALQLPPEAWLRLSVFNCSITYIMIKPNGYVSCRMVGDIGHLGYKETTFSGAHGLAWS